MDYNFIDKEVNHGGSVFKNGCELSSLQGRKTKINYKIPVLNDTAKLRLQVPALLPSHPMPNATAN